MNLGRRLRESIEGAKALNICSFRLAARNPSLLRNYISVTLQKYDELMEIGLPVKNPLRDFAAHDFDTLSVPLLFQTGGGTDPREILTLAAVTKLCKPARIFEIGTFNGRTTAVFILNSPSNCEVFTLDLPPDGGDLAHHLPTDVALVQDRQPEAYLRRAGLAGRYRQIYCDSMTFDPEPFGNSVELGFIDGAHAEEFVRNDTLKMAVMMSPRGFVFWHDYGGKGSFRPLSKYLESLPIELYRVPATSLAWTTASEMKKLVPPAGPTRLEVQSQRLSA
ncbi:MAG: O-methyltransferase family 3 [Candidatus Sulfotelmatobacter sp.]|nr:O-methyltransferase family 3 [Candidatus Sulfotelmatobacter sp.]